MADDAERIIEEMEKLRHKSKILYDEHKKACADFERLKEKLKKLHDQENRKST
jgi:hypothetical protein